jgi:hypothetical protein
VKAGRRKLLLIWVFRQRRAPAADWHDGQFAHDTHARFSLCLSANQFAHTHSPRIGLMAAHSFSESIERYATDLPNNWK